MYAIVDIAGQQFKVEKNQKVFVHRLDVEEGKKVDFDKVLLLDNEKEVLVGEPVLDGVNISAKVLSHVKGDKVIVFKKKRRKGYQKLNGHRQQFSQILIEDITLGAKKATATKAEPKAEEVKAEPKAATKAAETKEAKPKAASTAKPKAQAKPKAASTTKPKAEAKPKAKKEDKNESKPE